MTNAAHQARRTAALDGLKLPNLLAVDAKYPGNRWWLWNEDEGDLCGNADRPQTALKNAMREGGYCDIEELLEAGNWHVGMPADTACLLLLLDDLVGAGVPLEQAREIVERLDIRQGQHTDEEEMPFLTFYDVQDDGTLEAVLGGGESND